MELRKPIRTTREYQTIRLFAILGALTLMTVLLFKMVLFAPQNSNVSRTPTQTIEDGANK